MIKPSTGYMIAVIGTIIACGIFQRIAHPMLPVANTQSATIGVPVPCAAEAKFSKSTCTEQPRGKPTYKFMRLLRGGSVELLRTDVVYQRSSK